MRASRWAANPRGAKKLMGGRPEPAPPTDHELLRKDRVRVCMLRPERW